MSIALSGICIVVGEASGDAQGALLIRALKEETQALNLPEKHFWGTAGPLMRSENIETLINVEDLAVMGIVEVISHYKFISQSYKKILNEIKLRRPEAVILIDYPGFNLRLLQDVYALGITTIYHIPPKAWSHGASRAQILRNYSYLVTSILPFEVPYFQKQSVPVTFVGNPLYDSAMQYLQENKNQKKQFQIGMLPGSRKNEIKKLLPLFIESFIELKKTNIEVTAAIPIAKTIDQKFVKNIISQTALRLGMSEQWITENIKIGIGNAYEVMNTSSYAWVCSGTATLETAFFNTPMSAVYIVSPISAFIIRKIIKVKYVSLVNLIEDKEVIPEFLQEDANVLNLVEHAKSILNNAKASHDMKESFRVICSKFPSNSAKNSAKEILKCIEKYNVPSAEKFKLKKLAMQ